MSDPGSARPLLPTSESSPGDSASAPSHTAAVPVSVMISYSRTNTDFVDRIEEDLKSNGFTTWVDRSDIEGGAKWAEAITTAIDTAQVVLVVLSPAAISSRYVRQEYRYALKQNKIVIPLSYYPCPKQPRVLKRLQTIDFQAGVGFENKYMRHFALLIQTLKAYEPLDPDTSSTSRFGESPWLRPALLLAALVVLAISATRLIDAWDTNQISVAFHPFVLFGLLLLAVGGCACIAALVVLWRKAQTIEPNRLNRRRRELFINQLAKRYERQLDDKLQGTALIDLGLKDMPEAVLQPKLTIRETREDSNGERDVPGNTLLASLYDRADGHLLVLGDPGSGKSTSLLRLGQELLLRAQMNEKLPLPVIFSLTSWGRRELRHRQLRRWMAEELKIAYGVGTKLAMQLVEADVIFPLLDGLDEVQQEHRGACLDAINDYRRRYGILPLVVSSRTHDYGELGDKLDVALAVVVKPLSDEQINQFLEQGASLDALRELVNTNDEVRSLVATPLMLNIVSLAYRGMPATIIPPFQERKKWTHLVFRDYVRRMLEHRRGRVEYPAQQTIYWLSCLADQLQTRGKVFYLERMQPDLLPDNKARRHYLLRVKAFAGLGTGVLAGAVLGLGGGLYVGSGAHADTLDSHLILGILGGLPATLLFGLVAGLVFVLLFTALIVVYEEVETSFAFVIAGGVAVGIGATLAYGLASVLVAKLGGDLLGAIVEHSLAGGIAVGAVVGVIAGVLSGAIFGLLCGLVIGVADRIPMKWIIRTVVGLCGGLVSTMAVTLIIGGFAYWASSPTLDEELQFALFGLIAAVFVGGLSGRFFGLDLPDAAFYIHPSERVRWSWTSFIRWLRNGLLIGLAGGFLVAWQSEWGSGLIAGLVLMLSIGLLFGLSHGFAQQQINEDDLHKPNEGIWRSLRIGAILGAGSGVITGLTVGLAVGIISVLGDNPSTDPFFDPAVNFTLATSLGATTGLIVTIIVGLGGAFRGVVAFIQHWSLRYVLASRGLIPRDFERFLKFASDHILLQRVGGGYRFIHGLLQEYFVSLLKV